MTDPFATYPFALAAGGGTVDRLGIERVVMAGLALLRRSAPLVRALHGKSAAVLLPTGPQFLTALAASEGRAAVLINPLAARREIAFQLVDAGVGAVFTNAALAGRLPEGMPFVLLDRAPDHATVCVAGDRREFALTGHDALRVDGDPSHAGSNDPCTIVYTSAMRGLPLGAIATHRNLIANGRQTVEVAAFSAETHSLALLPWSHLFGLTVTATAPIFAGGRVTTMERFNPIIAADLLESAGITDFTGVPAVFAALLAAIERRGGRLRSDTLRVCTSGGSTLATEVQERWFDATGVELRQGYGLTEAGPVCLVNDIAHPNVRGTLGVPYPGVEVSLREPLSNLDDPGAAPPIATPDVPSGSEGEICVRGPNVGPGYVTRGRDGLQRRDGWLYTGDRGRRNDDGTVSFLGFYKPMFLRLGFNIYPREIEHAVGELSGITGVRIEAVPEPTREHDIRLHVTGSVDAVAVRQWCEERLSAYKQPVEILVSPT